MSAKRSRPGRAKPASANALAAAKLQEIVTSGWMAQAAFVAAKLNLADLLADGPKTSAELASATGTHAPSLHRLLRALTTIAICRECSDGSFGITDMGAMLGTQAPTSLRAWTLWSGAYMWPVWGNLLYSVTTGKSARTMLNGSKAFEHLAHDSDAAAVFNQALVELTRLTSLNIARACDFSGVRRIADVGGGYGELLACILKENPSLRGVLFDMPHAIDGAKNHLRQAGVAGRCTFAEGDFFAAVPGGADAYVLKSIIHDWNDEDALRILKNCRRAMTSSARLLLIERVVPARLKVSADHQSVARSDLHMLVALAARERTASEFRALLRAAGFNPLRIFPADLGLSIIMARPASL